MSLETATWNLASKVSGAGEGMSASWASSTLRKAAQSTILKLCNSGAGTHGSGSSKVVRIGMWSTPGPRRHGSVSQITTSSSIFALQKTLSRWVQFLVDLASKVGVPLGRNL